MPDPPQARTPTSAPERAATDPDQALELLLEGNRRWASGHAQHPNRTPERRVQLAAGQWPFATVFTCIDSRVTPEIVFDCGIGDLVVVRAGAHVLDETALMGSLQFGADRLQTPLVLVLGHEACGAVNASIETIDHGHDVPPGLRSIVEAVRPAYELAQRQGGDLVENTVRIHTRLTVEAMTQAPLFDRLADSGTVRVQGAYYSLQTGEVSLVD
jgi:carbonic anhydrase